MGFWEDSGDDALYDDFKRRSMKGIEKLFWDIGYAAGKAQSDTTAPTGVYPGIGL